MLLDLLYIYPPLWTIYFYVFSVPFFGMRMYMRFSSANPLRLTLIISPTFSSSFRERLTVISHRESSAASCLTGKYTNKIPFSSSSFFVIMASSILQYITFAVLLIGSPANAFGNGIQGGSGVAAVINSYSICLFSPFILCIIWGLFWAETFRTEPVFSCRFKPLSMQAGQSKPSACILCYSYFSIVQPVLPDAVPAPGFSGSVLFPLVRSLRQGFSFPFTVHGVTSSGEHIPSARSCDWRNPSMN